MLAVYFRVVLDAALLPSTHEMLELGISEGLRLLERGAYHGTRIMVYHPMIAAVRCPDEQTGHWMLQAPKRDSAVGGWLTSVCR
jgi:hypothetical protein